MSVTPDQRGCKRGNCNSRQRFIANGECEDCEQYEKAQNQGEECGSDQCSSKQKL